MPSVIVFYVSLEETMSDKMTIEQLVKDNRGQAFSLTLRAAEVLNEEEINISGRVFGIWNAPSPGTWPAIQFILVRFNRRDADPIRFTRGQVLAVPFNKIYVTKAAWAVGLGDMEILYGPDAFEVLRIYPNPPESGLADILTSLTAILGEVQGPQVPIAYGQTAVGLAAVQIFAANANRHGLIIQAPSTNGANFIYLGFTNAVVAANCFVQLAAGASWTCDDYRGDVYAIASLAAQAVNRGDW